MKRNRVGCTNLAMNSKVFDLRRRVISLIYEARKLVPGLGRVEVRIVRNDGRTLGVASLNVRHISIMECNFYDTEDRLRHVVFHELIHTLFGVRHSEECPLMKAIVNIPASKTVIHKLFIRYAKCGEMDRRVG